MSIFFYPQDQGVEGYPRAVPVFDHLALYDECVEHGIETDWWFSKANTVTRRGGEESSEAYLILQHKYIFGIASKDNAGVEIPAIDKSKCNHLISLYNNSGASSDQVYSKGWVYYSARAIDGSANPNDPNTLYLVKFVDKRHIYATNRCLPVISGALLYQLATGFNVVDPELFKDSLLMDPSDPNEFPYNVETLYSSSAPYQWWDILEALWHVSTYTADTGATMGFEEAELPSGGVYNTSIPIDVRPECEKTWAFFCKVLHATGNEIFPTKDGTFTISPIDLHFKEPATLDTAEYKQYLIEEGYLDPDDKRLPTHFNLTFLVRHLTKPEHSTNTTNFITIDPIPSCGLSSYVLTDPLISSEDFVQAGFTLVNGFLHIQDGSIPGQIEGHLTMGMTAVLPYAFEFESEHPLAINLVDFTRDVLTKLIGSRGDNQVDALYGCYLDIEPSPEFEEICWFINENGPCTRVRSLPSSIGVESVPLLHPEYLDSDRKVAADESDDTPAELIDKCEDAGLFTYDEEVHQLVYEEVVPHDGEPPKDTNNKVRWFTTLGTGEQGPAGPTGPAGPAGADGPTYLDGCGIIIADDTINFDPNDGVCGPGIQPDPYATQPCGIAVKPEDLVSCGLEVCTDNAANEEVRIRVKPSDLAGCGLKVQEDNGSDHLDHCKLAVDVSALAGCGLMPASDNTKPGIDDCKLKIDIDTIISPSEGIDKATGNQNDSNGPCKLKVKPNTTIRTLDPANPIELSLVGSTLQVKLYFKEYQVYAVDNSTPGSQTASVATTDCP